MAGLDPQRLVLVKATPSGGAAGVRVGSGYFVNADTVLTASHVLPDGPIADIQVRTEADGRWRRADPTPLWRDVAHDALLLHVTDGLPGVAEVAWLDQPLHDNAAYVSSGYPDAGKAMVGGEMLWKQVGLSGEINALGGGGQGEKELELLVTSAPPAEFWAGVSGAPIFVGERFAGFIRVAPASFGGARLVGMLATALLQQPGFRLALSAPWPQPLPVGLWVLVVSCEADPSALSQRVGGALLSDLTAIQAALGAPLHPQPVDARITRALASPGDWLRFVRVLCAAPIAIFDATGFEPGVMLALGVRAVVRRGLTLTSTADELTAAEVAELPFNIKETKVIHHGGDFDPDDPKHPHAVIAKAIKNGWQDLHAQPNYLDLPAYDAVRCPLPVKDAKGQTAVGRILMLCWFSPAYDAHWKRVATVLRATYPAAETPVVRMLNVDSPRLIGQALYEGIRWARTCVVDWTGWRANVFFEFGVRLACAELGPVCLLHDADAAAAAPDGQATQRRRLIDRFAPALYRLDAKDPAIQTALALHEADVALRPPPRTSGVLTHGATYRTCVDAFEWAHERCTDAPHDALRASIEVQVGADPQTEGRPRVLFAANAGYRDALDRSIGERWLAAWFYLSQRHPRTRWKDDPGLRAELRKLADAVLLYALKRDSADPHVKRLREEIEAIADELADLDAGEPRT